MTSQRVLLRRLRRVTTFVAVLGLAYLVLRFELVTLPADRCSPVTGYAPGDRLIVDGRPSRVGPGDAVLVQTRSGRLELTLVQAVREEDGALWCEPDATDCPGLSSSDAGWIDRRAMTGRVLLTWDY